MNDELDNQLFEELLNLKFEVASDTDDAESMPIYDEYFSSKVFDLYSDEFDYIEDNETKASDSPCWDGYKQIGMKRGKAGKMVPNCVPVDGKSAKQKLKNPKGGLTAAGREHFNKTEGSNLKPGVKGAADTPEKMRRKGSFLTRFFTNPSGPMVDEKGRATRLALSATAWGERVPKNAEDAAKLAEKGRKLLERYGKTKKKDDSESVEKKQLAGQTIGQQSGGTIGGSNQDAIDHDGDGLINDGTPDETRAPYKRQSAGGGNYERARRKFVRSELNRQKIKPNARVQDRSEGERNARAKARAAFDKQTVARGAQAQAAIGRANTDAASARRNQAQSDRLAGQVPREFRPADRYPEPPRGIRPGDGVNNTPKPGKPSDRKPADRYPNPSKPRDAEAERMERMRPKPRDVKPADRYPNPTRPDTKPADRYPEAPRGIRPGDGVNNTPKPGAKTPSSTRMGADRTERRIIEASKPGDKGQGGSTPSMRPGDGVQNRTKPGARTPSSTRPGADRTDRSVPNRKPDSADRASRSEYKPGYILEDADGQLQQYDGKPPKNGKYIREQRDGTLQQYGRDSEKPTIDRPRLNSPRGGGRPTIDRPRLDRPRGGGGPTIDRPRMPTSETENNSRTPRRETQNNSRTPIRETSRESRRNRQPRDF